MLAAEQVENGCCYWNDSDKGATLRLATLTAMANLNWLEIRLDTESDAAAETTAGVCHLGFLAA
jgi:hypothetical protein